jgi:transcriptional regulator with XRE-family HTH domain
MIGGKYNMEFNEKLQQLRKQKGLTQEELADLLYVSRTAISKWESGRGFPNIESLKAISKYFSLSLDELLSGEELLAIAEQDQKEKEANLQDLVLGLLDCGMALLLFLPFFGQSGDDGIAEVSLLALTSIQPYLKVAYFILVFAMIAFGIVTLTLQNCRHFLWMKNKHILSMALSVVGVCLFIISQQPYAAVFTFVFLMIKAFLLMKRR